MRQYELLYILPSKLNEDERQQVVENVNQLITANAGVLRSQQNWLSRKLSYPIEHIRQGVFMLTHFTAPALKLAKIRQALEMADNILRFVLVQFDGRQIKQPLTAPKILPQEAISKQPVPVSVSSAEPTKEKVSLEELDKKLAELLNEESNIK